MEEHGFEPLQRRARLAVRALVVVIVVDLVGGVHALVDARMLSRAIEDPAAVSQERLELGDTLAGLGGAAQLLAVVTAAILFLRWFHRATRNLAPLGHAVRYTPGWAVGSWFVPFVNIVIPKRATNDLWRAGEDTDSYPGVIDAWWILWLVSSFVSNGVGRVFWDAEELADVRSADLAYAAASALSIGAGVLAIRVVREITRRQSERASLGPDSTAPRGVGRTGLGADRHEPYRGADEGFSIEPGWKPAPAPD